MPLDNTQYDTIMREYSRRQNQNRQILEERRRLLYQRFPRLGEIDEETASAGAEKIRQLLRSSTPEEPVSQKPLREAFERLAEERKEILRSAGLPEDYLELPFTCPLCQDTGFINGEKCRCFLQQEISLLYSQSNLEEILKKENFRCFSFDYYSDTIKNEATGLTSRETAEKAYRAAKAFVADFDRSFENLFLYGSTGVGKTFLSNCIAHDLLESAHSVLYFTSFDLFDLLAGKKFSGREHDISGDILNTCDLLIIDDLGTELTNSFVASSLFLCINERILHRKSTIISTNLELKDVSRIYSERTFSRIASNYQLIKLFGDDIRILKKISGGN